MADASGGEVGEGRYFESAQALGHESGDVVVGVAQRHGGFLSGSAGRAKSSEISRGEVSGVGANGKR